MLFHRISYGERVLIIKTTTTCSLLSGQATYHLVERDHGYNQDRKVPVVVVRNYFLFNNYNL